METTRLLLLTLSPKTDDHRQRLRRGIVQLTSEDRTLTADTDSRTGDVTLGAVGELHLEIAVDRLKREFGVEASVGRPQIGYIDAPPAAAGQPRVRLEPIMRVEAIVPVEYEQEVVTDIVERRGHVESRDVRNDRLVVTGLVPLSELFGYATWLRDLTRGRGTFTMSFVEYRPEPPANDAGDEGPGVRAPTPLGPRPRLRSEAVPEPDEES